MEDAVTTGPGYSDPVRAGTDYPGTDYPGTEYPDTDHPRADYPGTDHAGRGLVGDPVGAPVGGPVGGPVEDPADHSVGDLLGRVTSDLSTLMRQEVELAKVEIKEEATKAGKASGTLVGAGLVGFLVLVFLSLAVMFGLDQVMPIGWAAVITAVLLAIVAAVLFAVGRRQLRQVNPKPEQTVETLKEDVQWAKNRTS